jgi:DNA-binding MarR family transcriptional regulator
MAMDAVDSIVEQWAKQRPDLDVGAIQVIGRISRLSRLIDRKLTENFARHGIEPWMYDVLATLRRTGEPYELGPTELLAHTMITSGAMTNRIDRLVDRRLVERHHAVGDRRRVVVRLTDAGRQLVDRVAEDHYRFEEQLLSTIDPRTRQSLTDALRLILIDLGDHPPER